MSVSDWLRLVLLCFQPRPARLRRSVREREMFTKSEVKKVEWRRKSYSAVLLWTHSSLWSDRKTRRSSKNWSGWFVSVSSESRTPVGGTKTTSPVWNFMTLNVTGVNRGTSWQYLRSNHNQVRAWPDEPHALMRSLLHHQTERWLDDGLPSTDTSTWVI